MPFTTSTELGRRVLIDDWMSIHRDRLLSVLYQMRDLGGDANGLTLQEVRDVSGLEIARVHDLIAVMRGSPPLVSVNLVGGPPLVTMTPRGVRWVEESPRPPT